MTDHAELDPTSAAIIEEARTTVRRVVTIGMLQERADKTAGATEDHYDAELDAVFVVKPLTFAEILDIRRRAGGDEVAMIQYLVTAGTVEPKLNRAEWGLLLKQTPGIPGRLAAKINQISGMGAEAAAEATKSA